MTASQFQSVIKTDLTATIASGATQSGAVDLSGCELMGIYLPSTFDGTTITIQTAPTAGGTYVDVLSAGSSYSLTCAASKYVPIENLAILAGCRFIKLTAGTSQSTTDSILTLAARPV